MGHMGWFSKVSGVSTLFKQKHTDFGGAAQEIASPVRTFDDVCKAIGLEPFKVRFIEKEFAEYFAPEGNGMRSTGFDARQVELLGKIHQMLFVENETPFAIRRKLSATQRGVKTIAITSGKGGVGKTTFSLNLAIAMAARGKRTLLMDADMGLGNVHVFAGVAPRGTMLDLIDGRARPEDVLTPGPGGVQLLCGNSGSARMADLSPQIITRLGHELAALSGDYDIMIIDTGAGLSSQVTRFLAMADEIVVVTTPNIAATLDAYGIIKVMREEAMRAEIRLVVNQAANGGEARAVAEKIRACSEKFLKYAPTILGCMVHDPVVEQANQGRKPLFLSSPDHLNSRMIARMAGKLCETPQPGAGAEEDFDDALTGQAAQPSAAA